MANKKTLDDLILEVLSEERLDVNKFGSMFGTSITPPDRSLSGLVDKTMDYERAFDALKPFDEDKTTLSVQDLKNLARAPENITTDVQAALISIVKKNATMTTDSSIIQTQMNTLKREIEESSKYLLPFVEYFNEAETKQKKLKNDQQKQKFKSFFGFKTNPAGKDLMKKNFLERIIKKFYEDNPTQQNKASVLVDDNGNFTGVFKNKSAKLNIVSEIYYLTHTITSSIASVNKKVRNFLKRYHELGSYVNKYKGSYHDKYKQLESALKFRKTPTKVKSFNQYASLAQQALDSLETAIKGTAGREQSITDPQVKSQRLNIGLEQPTYIQKAIENLGLTGDIKAKIDKISEISKKYYDAATGKESAQKTLRETSQKDLPKMLAEVTILDMFNSMSKEFDSGTGAYLFEYMLATITDGQVLGKEKTDAGKMGAADFIDNEGNPGSAKYYGRGEGLAQSVKGFRDRYKKSKEEVKIRYVIGIKKQGAEQISTDKDLKRRRGTSDPSRLMAIEIFTPMISYNLINNREVIKIDGTEVKLSGEDITISKHLKKSSGVLYMATLRTQTFREMIDGAFGEEDKLAQQVYNLFKTYLGEIKKARELGKEYTQTANPKTATQAHLSLNASRASLKELGEKMFDHGRRGSKFSPKQATLPLGENKSLKKLDKLIERVILEHINK